MSHDVISDKGEWHFLLRLC